MSRILTSWKEIAQYCGRGIRTVQRWERTVGLPIRRRSYNSHMIIATAEDIDAWLQNRSEWHASEVENLRARIKILEAEQERLCETIGNLLRAMMQVPIEEAEREQCSRRGNLHGGR